MTTLSGSTRKVFILAFILCSLMVIRPCAKALAQQATQYTPEEYSAYQAITGESDPAKKIDQIQKFYKTYPKSTLQPYIVSDFQGMLKGLQDGKKWLQIVTVGRQFLSLVPDDPYTIALVAAGYEETKNYKEFVVFGEEAYKKTPSGNVAYSLAKAYQSLGNNAKFVEWADKTVQKLPDNYEMLYLLAGYYSDAQNFAQADKYSRECLKVIQAAPKPEQMSEKDWATYTKQVQMGCYYILGSSAYTRNDFPTAITNLENSIKLNPRNDRAYYYLAQAYWQTQKTEMALRDFAKAYVLGGAVAGPAKQNLENLFKQLHRGSLVGLDKYIEVAKAELNK
jgi:tetratricopeptide (TPR) repeat protein